jgi:hypothetical protein
VISLQSCLLFFSLWIPQFTFLIYGFKLKYHNGIGLFLSGFTWSSPNEKCYVRVSWHPSVPKLRRWIIYSSLWWGCDTDVPTMAAVCVQAPMDERATRISWRAFSVQCSLSPTPLQEERDGFSDLSSAIWLTLEETKHEKQRLDSCRNVSQAGKVLSKLPITKQTWANPAPLNHLGEWGEKGKPERKDCKTG